MLLLVGEGGIICLPNKGGTHLAVNRKVIFERYLKTGVNNSTDDFAYLPLLSHGTEIVRSIGPAAEK